MGARAVPPRSRTFPKARVVGGGRSVPKTSSLGGSIRLQSSGRLSRNVISCFRVEDDVSGRPPVTCGSGRRSRRTHVSGTFVVRLSVASRRTFSLSARIFSSSEIRRSTRRDKYRPDGRRPGTAMRVSTAHPFRSRNRARKRLLGIIRDENRIPAAQAALFITHSSLRSSPTT